MLDDLVAGIAEHLEGPRPRRSYAVAVGVTYAFTDASVAAALPDASCVVVTKGAERSAGSRALLARPHAGIHTGMIGLDDLGRPRPDGRPPLAGVDDVDGSSTWLEPIRVIGRGEQAKDTKAHAKVLVLGWHEDELEWDYGTTTRTTWTNAWVGSANWTHNARSHAEFGMWAFDTALIGQFASFVVELISRSEPPGSPHHGPTPELVGVEYPEPDWELLDGAEDVEGSW